MLFYLFVLCVLNTLFPKLTCHRLCKVIMVYQRSCLARSWSLITFRTFFLTILESLERFSTCSKRTHEHLYGKSGVCLRVMKSLTKPQSGQLNIQYIVCNMAPLLQVDLLLHSLANENTLIFEDLKKKKSYMFSILLCNIFHPFIF